MTPPLRPLALLGLLFVGACADRVSAPDAPPSPAAAQPRDEGDDGAKNTAAAACGVLGVVRVPCFLRTAPDAPALAETSVSFWAVRGRERVGRIFYRPRAGVADSTEFVRLTVPALTVLQRPDGSVVAPGDSVRITLTVTDPAHGLVNAQPAGLKFTLVPAVLRFDHAQADRDVNADGLVDALDAALGDAFAVWRQESPTDPWAALPSVRTGTVVTALIPGFTNYILAY